jgi:cell fate regulator YaaT (PSP1 superfamily)
MEMTQIILVRYGAVPEVGRFAHDFDAPPARHERVVVSSHRGVQIGTTLENLRSGGSKPSMPDGEQKSADLEPPLNRVLRRATAEDESLHAELRRDADQAFVTWQRRIEEWNLALELLDIEWTLDRQKLVLYVLGGRGAETTKLALQAAAAGLAVVEVQPVNADGPVPLSAGGGGCGSGGCGCHE